MKRMSYKTLCKKLDDGDATVEAWAANNEPVARITTYDRKGNAVTREYEITGMPVETSETK